MYKLVLCYEAGSAMYYLTIHLHNVSPIAGARSPSRLILSLFVNIESMLAKRSRCGRSPKSPGPSVPSRGKIVEIAIKPKYV